jgi:hypothetical protein
MRSAAAKEVDKKFNHRIASQGIAENTHNHKTATITEIQNETWNANSQTPITLNQIFPCLLIKVRSN